MDSLVVQLALTLFVAPAADALEGGGASAPQPEAPAGAPEAAAPELAAEEAAPSEPESSPQPSEAPSDAAPKDFGAEVPEEDSAPAQTEPVATEPARPASIQANLRDPFAPVEPPAVARRVTVVHHYASPPAPPPLPASSYEARARDDDGFFFGGYGGLVLRAGAVSRKAAILTGVRGGFIFGKRMAIGGAFYRLSHRFGKAIENSQGDELALETAYGGLTADITLLRRGRLELAVGGLVGAGVGCISREFDYDDEASCIDQVRMFVGEPEAAIRINVAPWMRLSATGGYRFVVREPWRPPNDFTMSGGYGGLNLEFGWFGDERSRL